MFAHSTKAKVFILGIAIALLSVGIYLYSRNYVRSEEKKVETARVEQGEKLSVYSMKEYMDTYTADDYIVTLDLGPVEDTSQIGKAVTIRGIQGEPAAYLPLTCERVHANKKNGICVRTDEENELMTDVILFAADGKVDLIGTTEGHPNRARISPDGKYAAYTSFTSGDGYDAIGFSTRTYIVDVASKKIYSGLEEFELTHEGKVIDPIDKNFWGVTFFRNSDHFLATVMFGGIPYLVEGSVSDRRVKVIARDIECPSISPDETRIVYKKRGGESGWRLHAMDLRSQEITPLAEPVNVDDQVEWLDDDHVLYVRYNATAGKVNTMKLPADGTGEPMNYIENSFSPAVLH